MNNTSINTSIITYNPPFTNTNTNENYHYINNVGYSLIKSVELCIDGETIDKHYGEWLEIWDELTNNNTQPAINQPTLLNNNTQPATNLLTLLNDNDTQDENDIQNDKENYDIIKDIESMMKL